MNYSQLSMSSNVNRLAIFCLWLCLLDNPAHSRAAEINYKIGAIYHESDKIGQLAFRLGVRAANAMLARCRGSAGNATTAASSNANGGVIQLQTVLRPIPDSDPNATSAEVCRLLSEGVIAIAGPSHNWGSDATHAIVHSETALHAVPHVFVTPGVWNTETGHHFTINTHPSFHSIGSALLDFVNHQIKEHAPNQFRLAIVYADREALLKYETLFNRIQMSALIRQWRLQSGTYEYVMKYFSKLGQYDFLVDVPVSQLKQFFQTAHRLNMTREYYNFYFTTWDVDRVNFTELAPYFSGANLTAFSLVPRDLPAKLGKESLDFVHQIIAEQRRLVPHMGEFIPTEAALMHDALHMLAQGLQAATRSKNIQPMPLNCRRRTLWNDGATLVNYVVASTTSSGGGLGAGSGQICGGFRPLSGPISLDNLGFRSDFSLLIEERLPYPGSHQLGYWSQRGGLMITKNYTQTKEEIRDSLRKKTLRVTTLRDSPFVFYNRTLEPGQEPSPDPEHWDGFCIELLKQISAKLGFNISLHLVRDSQYGKILGLGPDGREVWNGMIGELMNRTADLAIASLTITYDRERVIDFTTPFMSLGLSIIYKKPQKEKPSLFSFLHPLSRTVWGYILAAYLIVSFILFTVARFSPFEWYNPHACQPDTDVVENQFNITNSMWFTIGSLMQQGSEMAPRANSTRIVSGSWWFFTLIMISSYTANLAAFLTVKRMKSPIENVEDLSKQKEIMYGILEGGSTFHFFQKATIPTYKSMFDFMSSNSAKCFVKSTPEGIERVLQENYAFILESTWNEYYTQRNCKLMQVGGLLDSKGYGIGMPAGSPYVDVFSETILELQKSQAIESLRQKWWRKFNISKPCDDTDGTAGNRYPTNALGLEQIGGAFIILTAGMLLSVLCAGIEFCFKHIKHSPGSLCANMWEELKFAVQCCVSSKRRASRDLYQVAYVDDHQPQRPRLAAADGSAVAAYADAPSASCSLGQLSRPDTLLSTQLASSFGHRQRRSSSPRLYQPVQHQQQILHQQQQQQQRPPKYNDCVTSTQL